MPRLYIVELTIVNKEGEEASLDITKLWDDKAKYYFWFSETRLEGFGCGIAYGEKYKAGQ